jgi:4-amino-4-deoxy-L-arabinose transferase-like glycosyltransferase
MDQALAAPVRTGWSLEHKIWLSVAAYFVALKLAFTFFAAPIADEAYYWLWGQHLALGYFDHPPLAGWLQGLADAVLGRSTLALRLFSLVGFVVVAAVIWGVARRIGGEHWRTVFVRSLVVYLASPVVGWFGSVVFIDYLLVALMMASGWFFFSYFTDVEEQGEGRLSHLFAAAALLGLAGLTKYNAGYMGIAVVATILIRPRLRPLLLRWPIYAAGALTLAMLTPLVVWSLQQGFASFQFHTAGRFGTTFTGINVRGMKAFAVDTASLLSWFLIPAIVSFFIRRQRNTFERVGKTMAIWVFWLSTATFLYIANYAWVMWWWNSAAFVLTLPFLGRYIGRVMLTLHALWGGLLTTALVFSFTIVPVTVLLTGKAAMETETAYGWERITAAVLAAKAETGADFLGANRYQPASQLAFALDDPDVLELAPRHTAFDDWTDEAALAGKTAIVLVDQSEDDEDWKARFGSIEQIETLEISQLGYPIATYRLFVGRDYRPSE